MHNLNKLRVYHLALENVAEICGLSKRWPEFGDLRNQIQRAAISVVSNIAEGAGSNSDGNFVRFLGYARASNKELQAQLEILARLSVNNIESLDVKVDQLGAMLYKLIQRLSSK